MAMMETTGNLWDAPADARCVTTNSVIKGSGRLVMGAGVARQALRRYPGIDKRLADLIKLFGNQPFFIPEHKIISFPTKGDWRDPSVPELIVKSAQIAVNIADNHNLTAIALSRPGCGCGGLSWDDVHPLIAPILDDRFTVYHPRG